MSTNAVISYSKTSVFKILNHKTVKPLPLNLDNKPGFKAEESQEEKVTRSAGDSSLSPGALQWPCLGLQAVQVVSVWESEQRGPNLLGAQQSQIKPRKL